MASYDSDLNTSQTQQMVEAAGLTNYRIGGSAVDVSHFNVDGSYTAPGTIASVAARAAIIARAARSRRRTVVLSRRMKAA